MILDLLRNTCKSLDSKGIKYMISGSIALNIYAIPRMTRDIDIVIELEENKIEELISIFPDSYFNLATIKEETRKKGMFNIIDNKTGFKIDFIIRKETEYFREAFNRRKKFKELDIEIWVISLEDLILAKLLWIQQYQSEKQMSDIENLMLDPNKDLSYIKMWCYKLKLNTFNLIENE